MEEKYQNDRFIPAKEELERWRRMSEGCDEDGDEAGLVIMQYLFSEIDRLLQELEQWEEQDKG